MASLIEIVEHFSAKTSNLKRCMEMRHAVDSPACISDLRSIYKELREVEQVVEDLRDHLTTEKQRLEQGRALSDVVYKYHERLEHISRSLPTHLPGITGKDIKRGQPTHQPGKHSKPNSSTLNGISKKHARGTCGTSNHSKDADVPKLLYLMVDEFDNIPKYIKGRITYDQANSAVDEINKVVIAKYKILRLPRSAMGEPVMKKYKAFKEAECTDTEGLYFFVDEDIKNYSNLKLDSKGRAKLTILRHCGRLKEVRGGGMLRYALKE